MSPEVVYDDTEASSNTVSERIETMKGWSFQYNPETDDYNLFFGLLDEGGESVSANVNADIRIVNDNGEEVFAATKSVTGDDFGYYESNAAGMQYLADIHIPAAEIKEGTSPNGTVYFTVYKGNAVRFDEVKCMALYCLPVSDIELTVDNLPVELKVKGYDGSTESIIKITEVSYIFEKEFFFQCGVTFTESGYFIQHSFYVVRV